jgi:hypothetical protein
MDYAFQYAETDALESESDYPYKGKTGTCSLTEGEGLVTVTGFVDVASNDPDQLKAAVAEGPVSVAIQANQFSF